MVHLLSSPFKKAPAPGREESVTTKQHAIAVIGDVATGVAGHMEHLEGEAVPGDLIAIVQPLAVVIRHGVKFGAIESGMGEVGEQFGDAAHMIMMMMGQQNGIELQPQHGEPLQHRRGLARIDHQAVIFVADQPDIVVIKGRNCDDGIHEFASL